MDADIVEICRAVSVGSSNKQFLTMEIPELFRNRTWEIKEERRGGGHEYLLKLNYVEERE